MIVTKIKNKLQSLYSKIKWKCKGFPSNCIIHYSNTIECSTLEGRNKVDESCVIRNSSIGYATFIAANSILVNCKIGKYSLIGFEALIGAHPLHTVASIHPALYSSRAQYGFTYVNEDTFKENTYADNEGHSIVIGNDVWVTSGKRSSTKIVQGVNIGDGAVVLADAVVTKDVPPYAIVGGVPATIKGYRFPPDEIAFLLELKWWDKDEKWIKDHARYFYDISVLKKVVSEGTEQ